MNEVYAGSGGNVSRNPSFVQTPRPEQPAPQQPPQSAAITNAMFERLHRLGALAERFEALADRIGGGVPADPKGLDGVAAVPNSLAGRLDVCIDGMDAIGARLTNALTRLERFA